MKAPGAGVQVGLAAVSLVLAYTTWQREPERKPGEVVIVEASLGDLDKIRYEDQSGKEPKWVELERRKEADGPHPWLRVSAKADAKQPERELRGNESAQKLFDKFAPLKGSRSLGVLSADKLKEVSLAAPKKRIEVTVHGQKRVLLVGISPFGVSDPYVRDEADGKVYVLGGGVLSDLDSAGIRLVDRQLHDWKPTEVDHLKITVDGKSKELTQIPGETPAQTKLADKTGKVDEMVKAWHEKLWRVLVSEVLGKGEVPKSGAPVLALRVDYQERGHDKGFVEFGRVQLAPVETTAATPASPPKPTEEIYARSESTAGWVKISVAAEDLLKEAPKVVAE